MAARETVLLIGRDALAHDVARTLAAGDTDTRTVTLMTRPDGSASTRVLDPASPSASRDLAEVLTDLRPAVLVVLALSQSAVDPASPWAADSAVADVVVSGLERCVEHGGRAPALLFLSSTAVYGVAAASPVVFDERSRLPRETVFGSVHARWAEGLRSAERRLVLWAVSSGVRVGVLRTTNVLGGCLDSPLAGLLRARVPVRVLGYDPPCQAVHYDDVVEAVALAVTRRCGEVLNIVGREVTPLSRVLAMAGVFAPALPGLLADRLAPASMDGAHLRWRTLADGRRATALLGFRPRRTLEECLRASR